MKKLSSLSLLVALMVSIACGGDETQKFELLLDETIIEDLDAYYDEWGGGYYGGLGRTEIGDDTHNRYPIMFTDGTYTEEMCWPEGYSNQFVVELFSPIGEEIELGAYTIDYYGYNGSNLTGVKFGNVWSVNLQSDTRQYSDADGTVTLSGSFPDNIRLDFDLKMYYYEGPVRTEGSPSTFVEFTGTYKGELLFRNNCD